MVKGYTNETDVQNYLGVSTLAALPNNELTTMLAAVETFIDRETRKSWLTPAITGERYTVLEPVIYLKQHPVASIQSLQSRSTAVGDTLLTLTAGTDYELQDTNLGEVRLANGLADHAGAMLIFASYTPNQPVPADISRAACLICAHSLYLAQYPNRWGISEARMDEHTVATFQEGAVTLSVPELAQTIINGYTLPIWG